MTEPSSPPAWSETSIRPASWERGPGRAAWQGAWRFALVSLGGFSVWALGGRWFYAQVGEVGLYVACTVVFIGLAALLIPPLAPAPRRMLSFVVVFIPAFLAYAAAWCGAWFWKGFGAGEWLGSLAGSVAFVVVTASRVGGWRMVPWVALVFFVSHSAGYFAGDQFMKFVLSEAGVDLLGGLGRSGLGYLAKLGWGCCYGLGFGAGLGYTYAVLPRPRKPRV